MSHKCPRIDLFKSKSILLYSSFRSSFYLLPPTNNRYTKILYINIFLSLFRLRESIHRDSWIEHTILHCRVQPLILLQIQPSSHRVIDLFARRNGMMIRNRLQKLFTRQLELFPQFRTSLILSHGIRVHSTHHALAPPSTRFLQFGRRNRSPAFPVSCLHPTPFPLLLAFRIFSVYSTLSNPRSSIASSYRGILADFCSTNTLRLTLLPRFHSSLSLSMHVIAR